MKISSAKDLLIGAHTSAGGGVANALIEGKSIGATTVQLFTANQRQWKAKGIDQNEVSRWQATIKETGLKEIMSHDSYLINLGAASPENLIKSRQTFSEEILRCKALGISYLNFHPGAAVGGEKEECLDRIVESLQQVQPLMEDGSLRLLLETTAGQGSTVGNRFEDLAYIIEKVGKKIPLGVCIDTCHIFVAGYDIRTPDAWEKTLNDFKTIIGLEWLYAFHLNDSIKGLGSRVDRHAPLGEGMIGLDSFKFLMQDSRTRALPKFLETPGGDELWIKEIALLREFAEQ